MKKLNNRLLSKFASAEEFSGDSARRTAVYIKAYEDSSTESTKKLSAIVEFQKKSIILLVLFSMFALVGCATPRKNVFMPPNILEKPDSLIIGHLEMTDNATFLAQGNIGLLDWAVISAATNKMKNRLAKISTVEGIQKFYYKKYTDFFSNHNFKVQVMLKPLAKKKLTSSPNKGIHYAPYDFTPLKNQFNVNYALILDVKQFAAIREYYSMIPTSKPTAHSIISIYLINLADNSIVGEYNGNIIQNVQGNWDSPPDYKSLVEAVQSSLIQAFQESYVLFHVH